MLNVSKVLFNDKCMNTLSHNAQRKALFTFAIYGNFLHLLTFVCVVFPSGVKSDSSDVF